MNIDVNITHADSINVKRLAVKQHTGDSQMIQETERNERFEETMIRSAQVRVYDHRAEC